MLVFQYFILLYNYMIVMLNELNLFVYICNDFDQNKLVQSGIMYYIILYLGLCFKIIENRSIIYYVYRESCKY